MKKKIVIILSLGLFLTACSSQSEKSTTPPEPDSPAPELSINPENLISLDIDVSGMTCTGCENTIEKGVSELAGISSVNANHMEAKTYVEFDSTLSSLEEITAAIEASGYKVEDSKTINNNPEESQEVNPEQITE